MKITTDKIAPEITYMVTLEMNKTEADQLMKSLLTNSYISHVSIEIRNALCLLGIRDTIPT